MKQPGIQRTGVRVKTITEPDAEARLAEGVSKAYSTRDFYFAAYCLTLTDLKIRLVDLRPYRYKGGRDVRYDIILTADTAEGVGLDAKAVLEPLSLQFVSGETSVEPRAFITALDQLRSRISDIRERDRRIAEARRDNRKGTRRNERNAR